MWSAGQQAWHAGCGCCDGGARRGRPRGEPLVAGDHVQLFPGLAEEVEHLLIPKASGGYSGHGPDHLARASGAPGAAAALGLVRSLAVRLLAYATAESGLRGAGPGDPSVA